MLLRLTYLTAVNLFASLRLLRTRTTPRSPESPPYATSAPSLSANSARRKSSTAA